jgi:hypothetical protein
MMVIIADSVLNYDYKALVLIITANQKNYGNNIADCAWALALVYLAYSVYFRDDNGEELNIIIRKPSRQTLKFAL